VTLIAALPYLDGIVVAADSLEAVGDYKVSVDKVRPQQCGRWWVIFGGAGNDGALIDALEQRLHVAITKHRHGDVLDSVRKAVLEFNKREVAAHPAVPDNKRVEGILCVKMAESGMPRLFSISGSVVMETRECLLAGWDATLYKNVVKRSHVADALVNQGVGLALELFRLANDTCLWVGGPTKLFVVTDAAIFEEEQDDVAAIESQLIEVTKRLTNALRSCSDTTTHPQVLEVRLDWLRHELIELHAAYLRMEGRKIIKHLPAEYVSYQKLPYGTILVASDEPTIDRGFALGLPDVPIKYGSPLGSSPPEDVGKPGTTWRMLALNEQWKQHGKTVKFKPIAVRTVEDGPNDEELALPPPTYLEKKNSE
jgi:hypothetical protein